MKWVLGFVVLLFVAALALAVFMRSVGHDRSAWHVDPATVTDVRARNQHLGEARIGVPPSRIWAYLAVEAHSGRIEPIAGESQDGPVTYVVRSSLIGFPDYVSLRIKPEGEGSHVTIFSRSRFGYSDMGANRKRVMHWIVAMRGLEE